MSKDNLLGVVEGLGVVGAEVTGPLWGNPLLIMEWGSLQKKLLFPVVFLGWVLFAEIFRLSQYSEEKVFGLAMCFLPPLDICRLSSSV